MKQKDGNITNDRLEILNVCADFYQELYSSKSSESKPNIISPHQSAIPQVTVREVEVAIKEMKDNKAPGTDDITSDIIKMGGAGITKELTKKLQTRMKCILDENQPKEQAGFRSAYSTMDRLHALNQVIEKANEYNLELCVGYIDNE